ncbi:MAG: aminoglycoside phosphotransferase family protein [Pseudomonadota bacterium]
MNDDGDMNRDGGVDAAAARIAARFGAANLRRIARTDLATVWRARSDRYGDVALKVYGEAGPRNERLAAGLLRAWRGRGAVRLLAEDGAALILEFANGGSLGDLVRRGEDEKAVQRLAEVARCLHKLDVAAPATHLSDVFAPLLREDLGAIANPALRRDVDAARGHAAALLADGTEERVLHGDLHFDNVLLSERGWLAIDPKSYLGDPAFELANAFRNPKGAEALMRDPARVDRLADQFSEILEVDRARLLRWAAAKCAHSLHLGYLRTAEWPEESDLLSLLHAKAEERA